MKKILMLLAVGLVGCGSAQTKSSESLPVGAYTGTRWALEAAKLTKAQRDELADLTPGLPVLNGASTWNRETLRWEQDFPFEPDRKGAFGPRAILPMSVARAWPEQQRKAREAKENAERKEGTKGSRWRTWKGEDYFSDSSLMGSTGLQYVGPVVWRAGKWVVDEERAAEEKKASDKADARRRHIASLWVDLRTRPVTDEELKEAIELGVDLVPERDGGVRQFQNGETFSGDYNTIMQQRRSAAAVVFDNALLNQMKIRALTKEAK